jgi:AcrR family transcriptional regulator
MDKRQQNIDAARARFRHFGIQKTTMQEIADDAGVAGGTLCRYFADKDDLTVACADEFIAIHRRQVEEALTPGLRRDVLARYHHCRDVGTASRHAAELARAVLRLEPTACASRRP